MAFNGSGTFIRNDGFLTGNNICQTQEATSVNRLSLRFDNEFNEIATALGACVTKNGETGALTQPLDFGSQKGINLATPSANTDAATKAYADGKLALSGGNMSGDINMVSHKIVNLGAPTAGTDAANKSYVDTNLGSYLPLAGGTLSGALTLGGNLNANGYTILNVPTPSAGSHAVNKTYADGFLPLSGGSLTGDITLNSNNVNCNNIQLLDTSGIDTTAALLSRAAARGFSSALQTHFYPITIAGNTRYLAIYS